MPRLLVLAMLGAAGTAAPAEAQYQSPSVFRPRSLQASAGVTLSGGVDFGAARATLTANEIPPSRYTLFETESALGSVAGFEGRLGFMLTRSLAVEGGFRYARPRLETRVSADVEGAAGVTALNDVSEYMVDVSGVIHLERLRFGSGGVPFVLAGAGYLRELYEDRVLVETGQTFHAGGGIKYVFRRRPRGLLRGLALRADARLYVRSGGVELDAEEPSRTFGSGGASLVVLF